MATIYGPNNNPNVEEDAKVNIDVKFYSQIFEMSSYLFERYYFHMSCRPQRKVLRYNYRKCVEELFVHQKDPFLLFSCYTSSFKTKKY